MLNKRAQSETIIWVGATVVIIIFSIIYLFAVGVLAKTKGVGFEVEWISGGDSGARNQQMLFALLSKETEGKKVIELIEEEDFGKAYPSIDNSLREFASAGIRCEFALVQQRFEIKDPQNPVSGKMVSIKMGDEEARLTCK